MYCAPKNSRCQVYLSYRFLLKIHKYMTSSVLQKPIPVSYEANYEIPLLFHPETNKIY